VRTRRSDSRAWGVQGGIIPPWSGSAGLVGTIDPRRNEPIAGCDGPLRPGGTPRGVDRAPTRSGGGIARARGPWGRSVFSEVKRNGSSGRFASLESERDRSLPRGAETAAQQPRAPQSGAAGPERSEARPAQLLGDPGRKRSSIGRNAAPGCGIHGLCKSIVVRSAAVHCMVVRRGAPPRPTRPSNKSTNGEERTGLGDEKDHNGEAAVLTSTQL
jgi:hypothetical protein